MPAYFLLFLPLVASSVCLCLVTSLFNSLPSLFSSYRAISPSFLVTVLSLHVLRVWSGFLSKIPIPSPRHRIPEARVCPPAPKKPVHLLYMKRKARRRLDDIEGEIGSFLGAELDDAGPRTKKARGEATNA